MPNRNARYGRNLYEVTVPDPLHPQAPHKLYLCADSITVREGTLMLAAEVEEEDDTPDGEARSIELPPVAIFAPGHWISVLYVTWGEHEVLFSEDVWQRVAEEAGDDDEDEDE